MMGEGLWTEMGGEFIDTDHEDMLNLARHFNLPLLDRHEASEMSLKELLTSSGKIIISSKMFCRKIRRLQSG